jgi:hypothetical protein
MIDPDNVPEILEAEQLARYITQSGQFRSGDLTVKPELFMPHPRFALSVTRHLDATEAELWQVGTDVSDAMSRQLYGRSDIQARHCAVDNLAVLAKPLPKNPNHADIEGWPSIKQDQKMIALKLAAAASKLIKS